MKTWGYSRKSKTKETQAQRKNLLQKRIDRLVSNKCQKDFVSAYEDANSPN
jgi:hypothetical protein